MKKFETIKKATVYKMAGNKYEPTGKILPPKTVFMGNPVSVTIPHGNPIDFIQISGFRSGTPTYVFPSDVKPFGAIPSKSSNFIANEKNYIVTNFSTPKLYFKTTDGKLGTVSPSFQQNDIILGGEKQMRYFDIIQQKYMMGNFVVIKSNPKYFVWRDAVMPYGVGQATASNFTEGDTTPATAMDWAKELFSIVISLAVLFLLVYVISKAWKMGQAEKTGTVKA